MSQAILPLSVMAIEDFQIMLSDVREFVRTGIFTSLTKHCITLIKSYIMEIPSDIHDSCLFKIEANFD